MYNTLMLWVAKFLPPLAEVDQLYDAAVRMIGRHGLAYGPDVQEGPDTFDIYVDGPDDPDAATLEAGLLYQRIRSEAGLDENAAQAISLHEASVNRDATTDEFLATARWMLEQAKNGFAVVAAQGACE